MSCYYCTECDRIRDGDYIVCSEHPVTGKEVCEDCYNGTTPSAADILGEIKKITDDYFKKLDKVVEKGQ